LIERGLTYDTGALVAAERGDRELWLRHRSTLAAGRVVTVPAPVLAQAWRGGAHQAKLARLMAGCAVEPLPEDQARRIGELAGRAGHADIVDVAVVEGAARRGDAVLTSGLGDLRRIAFAADRPVPIHPI